MRQLPVELVGPVARKKAVVELDGMLCSGRYRSPWTLVSYADGLPTKTGSECMLFLAEEDGAVLDWQELHAVYGMDFPDAYAAMLDWLEGAE